LRVAAIQLNFTPDADPDLRRADRLIRDAAARGAE
jgi:predicted amidohydrolase